MRGRGTSKILKNISVLLRAGKKKRKSFRKRGESPAKKKLIKKGQGKEGRELRSLRRKR